MLKKTKVAILFVLLLTGCNGTMAKLGVNNGQLSECPSTPNCVCSQSTIDEKIIAPLVISGDKSVAKASIFNLLSAIKRSKVIVAEDNYIHAEFTSALFRFVDDVEFYFPETQDNQTIIHVRSASRTGRSDFGVNRKRVELFRTKLK